MPKTIPEYAKERHISRQAVDKVLKKRPDINDLTHMGISNGKQTKYLSDEAVAMLDQIIRMPYQQNVEEVSKELQLQFAEQENANLKIERAVRDRLENVQNELKSEVLNTRDMLLNQSDTQHTELMETIKNMTVTVDNSEIMTKLDALAEKDKKIEELRAEVDKLNQQIAMLNALNSGLQEQVNRYKADSEQYHKTLFGLYKRD